MVKMQVAGLALIYSIYKLLPPYRALAGNEIKINYF
jgi:hypothetical protein